MFTPKIIHEEDSDLIESRFLDDGVELDLPHDLTLLAGRLSKEAALLAERYPAEGSPLRLVERAARPAESDAVHRPVGASADHPSAGRFFGPALVLLLAVSVGAVIAWNYVPGISGEGANNDATSWSVSFRPEGAREFHPVVAPQRGADESSAAGEAVPASANLSPSSFVHELTGPEFEGLLDLLQGDDAAESRLSI